MARQHHVSSRRYYHLDDVRPVDMQFSDHMFSVRNGPQILGSRSEDSVLPESLVSIAT